MNLDSQHNLESLAQHLGTRLIKHGALLRTAESCTGGMISAAITAVPGSSAWFERGLVTYSNRAKHELLGVPKQIFDDKGAVSGECARAMVLGLWPAGSDGLGVAVTGIAGPDGGTTEKPVGTVWIAWRDRDGHIHAECNRFDGDRQQVRLASASRALHGLIALLSPA